MSMTMCINCFYYLLYILLQKLVDLSLYSDCWLFSCLIICKTALVLMKYSRLLTFKFSNTFCLFQYNWQECQNNKIEINSCMQNQVFPNQSKSISIPMPMPILMPLDWIIIWCVFLQQERGVHYFWDYFSFLLLF